MPDLLLEIGAEEMPVTAVLPALEQMKNTIAGGLNKLRLTYGDIETYGTPRRLAILVRGVAERQPDQEVEYKGPPAERAFSEDGQATNAAYGFAKARGVDVKDLSIKETDNGTFVAVTVREEGRPAGDVLPQLLEDTVTSLNFPKTMRWGDLDMRFVRPIRWLVGLLDEQIIEFSVAGLTSGRESRGHRKLASGPVVFAQAADYVEALEAAFVIADHRRRREMIVRQAQAAAAEFNGVAVLHDDVVDENNFLVEWPLCVIGSFDERFLKLPDAVSAMVMEKHQSYFPVAARDGALMAKFIFVGNMSEKAADVVRAGNEKVIAARLADGEFYITEDTKITPDAALMKLRRVTFIEKLGTLYDKVERLQVLTKWLAERIGADDDLTEDVQRAALLCKNDQTTQMIGDNKLAGLQGSIGAYYAGLAGERDPVCDAISEQYMPASAEAELPVSQAGALLAIADKVDNLAASFYIGMEPTGTKDPMGLRRQAHGLIRICMDRDLHFSIDDMFSLCIGLLPSLSGNDADESADAGAKLHAFCAARVQNILEAAGVSYDVIRAVLGTPWHDVVEVVNRTRAVDQMRADDDEFEGIVDTATRPANISRPADIPTAARVESALFTEAIEGELWAAYRKSKDTVAAALDSRFDYKGAWRALKEMRAPIDAYFNAVMVNVDDEAVRANRLALMRDIDRLYCRLADFTQIVQ